MINRINSINGELRARRSNLLRYNELVAVLDGREIPTYESQGCLQVPLNLNTGYSEAFNEIVAGLSVESLAESEKNNGYDYAYNVMNQFVCPQLDPLNPNYADSRLYFYNAAGFDYYISLDIETNQFYDFSGFLHYDFVRNFGVHKQSYDAETAADLCSIFQKIENSKTWVREQTNNGLGGFSIIRKVFDEAVSEVYSRIWSSAEPYIDKQNKWDNINKVVSAELYDVHKTSDCCGRCVPSHAEIYMIGACIMPMTVDKICCVDGYNWGSRKVPVYMLSKQEFTKLAQDNYHCYKSIDEFDVAMTKLMASNKIHLTAHNLSYEANLLLQNCSFLKKAVAEGRAEHLCNSSKDSYKNIAIYDKPRPKQVPECTEEDIMSLKKSINKYEYLEYRRTNDVVAAVQKMTKYNGKDGILYKNKKPRDQQGIYKEYTRLLREASVNALEKLPLDILANYKQWSLSSLKEWPADVADAVNISIINKKKSGGKDNSLDGAEILECIRECKDIFAAVTVALSESSKWGRDNHRAIVLQLKNMIKDCDDPCVTDSDFVDKYSCPASITTKDNNSFWNKVVSRVSSSTKIGAPRMAVHCTWKLTGESISSLGKKHNLLKNGDGSAYDYDVIRKWTPGKGEVPIGDEDIMYNKQDCVIAAVAFHSVYNQNKYLVAANPCRTFYSTNNLVKADCAVRLYSESKIAKKNTDAMKMGPYTYAVWRQTTAGGFISVNPVFAGYSLSRGSVIGERHDSDSCTEIAIKDFGHVDIVSAHPSNANLFLFPQESPKHIANVNNNYAVIKDRLRYSFAYAEYLTENAEKNTLEEALADYKSRYVLGVDHIFCYAKDDKYTDYRTGEECTVRKQFSGIGLFKLTNVRVKKDCYGSCIPCLSNARFISGSSSLPPAEMYEKYKNFCSGEIERAGSKIIEADEYSSWLTAEDLIILSMFYTFDFELHDWYEYRMDLCHKNVASQFELYGGQKVWYKKFKGWVTNNDTASHDEEIKEALLKGYLLSSDVQQIFFELSKGNHEEACRLADAALSRAKARFNGVYGTNYQGIERRNYNMILDDEGDITKSPVNDKGTQFDYDANFPYMVGAYIALWSRVQISLGVRTCINFRAIPLYVATDSIYYAVTNVTSSYINDILTCKAIATQTTKDYYIAPDDDFVKIGGSNLAEHRKNIWDLGGLEEEEEYIHDIAYTMPLKLISRKTTKVKVALHDGTRRTYDATETSITFSGCAASVFFKHCHKTYKYIDKQTGDELSEADYKSLETPDSGRYFKLRDDTYEDFLEHYYRLVMFEGYIGPFDDADNGKPGKSIKATNDEEITKETGYVIAKSQFVNNRHDSETALSLREYGFDREYPLICTNYDHEHIIYPMSEVKIK